MISLPQRRKDSVIVIIIVKKVYTIEIEALVFAEQKAVNLPVLFVYAVICKVLLPFRAVCNVRSLFWCAFLSTFKMKPAWNNAALVWQRRKQLFVKVVVGNFVQFI